MRKMTLILALLIVFTTANVCHGATDRALVKKYCKKHFPKYKITYTTEYSPKHKSNSKITVTVIKSFSNGGRYGTTLDGATVKYNKSVKKGKKVKSYLIWNPENESLDDIMAVVDNKKIR